MESRPLIIQALAALQSQFDAAKKEYYDLNDDLKKYDVTEGETLRNLHQCYQEMDTIYSEKLFPVLKFIADHYDPAHKMRQAHHEFKKANAEIHAKMLEEDGQGLIKI